MKLIADVPSSEGVRNGLKRARRLVEAKYTPVKPLPIVFFSEDNGVRTYHETVSNAYLPRTGFPYSSVRRVEKYIGYNVSFETFYTALSDPDSVIYTRPIKGTGQNVHAYYGIVCSCFASEVLDIKYRTPCLRWPELPGISEPGITDLKDLRLLDIVLNVKKHIAVITGIERDEDRNACYITVSESVLPFCRRTRFTTEEFTHYWLDNGYKIYRYAYVDGITYEPDPFVPLEEDGFTEKPYINDTLMPDFGNKANYRMSEQVTFHVFKPGFGSVCVRQPDGSTETIPVTDGRATFTPKQAGIHEASAVSKGGASVPVLFCVTDLKLSVDRPGAKGGEKIRVCFENAADEEVIAWQFNLCATDRGCGGGTFDGLGSSGEVTLVRPEREGDLELYFMAKNAYGVYTSDRIKLPYTG